MRSVRHYGTKVRRFVEIFEHKAECATQELLSRQENGDEGTTVRDCADEDDECDSEEEEFDGDAAVADPEQAICEPPASMPDLPASRLLQDSATVLPTGLTQPRPVTTTRRRLMR